MKRLLPALVTLAVILAVIAALFLLRPGPTQTAGPAGPRVIIISPHNEGIQTEFKRAFEAWHQEKYGSHATVEWRDHGGTSDNVRYIESEFARTPMGIGIDIFWGGGVEPYIRFAEMNLLHPCELPPEILNPIPPTVAGVPVYDPRHRWYGTALSGFGIIYNKKRLAAKRLPEPRTWADLARPEFLGELAAADPRSSGTAHAMVEVILQAYGYDKGFDLLTRIAGNARKFTRSAGDVPKLVGMGDVAAGLAIDFYAWNQIQQDGKERIGYVLPEGLTAISPDAIGILLGAPNRGTADRFLQFVLSEQGQQLWVLPRGAPGGPAVYELLRIPVLPHVYTRHAHLTNVMFDPSTAKPGFHYDALKATARREALKDLYGALFIDLAPELSAAWKALIRRGLPGPDTQTLCTPPIAEKELTDLSVRRWSDPEFRNAKIAYWTNAARKRYRALAR